MNCLAGGGGGSDLERLVVGECVVDPEEPRRDVVADHHVHGVVAPREQHHENSDTAQCQVGDVHNLAPLWRICTQQSKNIKRLRAEEWGGTLVCVYKYYPKMFI